MDHLQAWLISDPQGHQALVRSGSGRVTAVVGLGSPPTWDAYRVEIKVDRPVGRTRAIRFTTHGLLASSDPLVAVALEAEAGGVPVQWTIEWVRLPDVPGHIPIEALDLAADARAAVRMLRPTAIVNELPLVVAVDAEDEIR